MSIYRYTVESADGQFITRDIQFDSDIEARANLFRWFVAQMQLIGIILFKYNTADTCGTFRKIDQFYRPAVIFF